MSVILWATATALSAVPMQQTMTMVVPQDSAPSTTPTPALSPPAAPTPAVSAPVVESARPLEPAVAPEPVATPSLDQDRPPADPAPVEAAHPGEIIVTARDPSRAIDPLRGVNEKSFEVTEAVDKAIIGPVALAYKKTAPKPFRNGVHNILYNLREPVVFVNFVLQHKIGKAAETVGRFAINSTIGLLGAFDIAKKKPFRLPRRGNGFADTLGFYGVPNGPFMFLPIVGPTTVRDLFGGAIDRLVLPFAVGKRITRPEFVVPLGVLGVLDHRSELDDTLHTLHDNVPDPYANTRTFYLQRRQAEIDHLRGKDTGASSPMSEAPKAAIDSRGREIKPDTAKPR